VWSRQDGIEDVRDAAAQSESRNRHNSDDTSEKDAVFGAYRTVIVQSLAALHRRDHFDCHFLHVVSSM
jgi:hypothetical protein